MGQRTGQFWRRGRGAVALLALVLTARAHLAGGAFAQEAGVASEAPEAGVVLPDAPPIPVPSGQMVRFIETISDAQGPMGLTLRFRFLAPQIGGTDPLEAEAALSDMEALCNSFALQRLPTTGPAPAQIVISLADRWVPFGEVDTEAVQYFEAYSVADGACIWEFY